MDRNDRPRTRVVPHIFLEHFGKQRDFEPTSGGGSGIDLPDVDRGAQYRKIRDALRAVHAEAAERRELRDRDLAPDDPALFLAFQTYDSAFDPAKFQVDGRQLALVSPVVGSGSDGEPQILRYRGVTIVHSDELKKFERKVYQYGEGPLNATSGKPRNAALVGVLDDLHLASLEDLWTDTDIPSPTGHAVYQWEVWLRKVGVRRFSTVADRLGIAVEGSKIDLAGRQVQWVHATRAQMEVVVLNSDSVAELRSGRDRVPENRLARAARMFAIITPAQVTAPRAGAPAVCVMDTGTTEQHPLLAPGVAPRSVLSASAAWGPGDPVGHGTAVSGIALYGSDLRALDVTRPVALAHGLESVRIIENVAVDSDSLARLTNDAVARIEIEHPERRRVYCIASTTTRRGSAVPTTWSMAIDALSSQWNAQRLFVVAAGNVREEDHRRDRYPDANDLQPITEPAQAYNALTVGGYTELVDITEPTYMGYAALADMGNLSPHSRTSNAWVGRAWKPDVVMEAGNFAAPPGGHHAPIDDLQLVSTSNDIPTNVRMFDATSAAAPQAAALAADILASDDRYWPETARALAVHHAEWTEAMRRSVQNGLTMRAALRRWGYGVPNRERALQSARDRLTIVVQDQLQPYHLEEHKGKHKEMSLHVFPLPIETLQRLGEMQFELRYTLSYFVEPLPYGVDGGLNYASHVLRVKLTNPNEPLEHFLGRVNKADREEGRKYGASASDHWRYGKQFATGSIISDYLIANATELAAREKLVVIPQVGWWRERPEEERIDHPARYTLVVSLRPLGATDVEIDLYTPVLEALAGVRPEGTVIDGR